MHDDELLNALEHEFTTVLLHARQTLLRRAKEIHPDLQAPGYRILSILMRDDAQQQGYLAEVLQLDKATISRLVKQLEAQELISRITDPSDGRAQLVSITTKAREAWLSSGQTVRRRLHERLSEWSSEDVQRFTELLHRLNGNTDESATSSHLEPPLNPR